MRASFSPVKIERALTSQCRSVQRTTRLHLWLGLIAAARAVMNLPSQATRPISLNARQKMGYLISNIKTAQSIAFTSGTTIFDRSLGGLARSLASDAKRYPPVRTARDRMRSSDQARLLARPIVDRTLCGHSRRGKPIVVGQNKQEILYANSSHELRSRSHAAQLCSALSTTCIRYSCRVVPYLLACITTSTVGREVIAQLPAKKARAKRELA